MKHINLVNALCWIFRVDMRRCITVLKSPFCIECYDTIRYTLWSAGSVIENMDAHTLLNALEEGIRLGTSVHKT